jgi:hypothetical protein
MTAHDAVELIRAEAKRSVNDRGRWFAKVASWLERELREDALEGEYGVTVEPGDGDEGEGPTDGEGPDGGDDNREDVEP